MAKKKPGLTAEQHLEMAARFKRMSNDLAEAYSILLRAYRIDEFEPQIRKISLHMNTVRCKLDSKLFSECDLESIKELMDEEEAKELRSLADIYYGKGHITIV